MALEVFNGNTLPREFATAPMEYLLAKWKVLSATGELTLQRLTEETSYPLRPNLMLLTTCEDDFVHVYVGEALLREAGETAPRGRLSQGRSALAGEFADVYRRSVQHLKPVFVRFTEPGSHRGTVWQRLILPVPLSDGLTMIVAYSEPISHSLEIYEHLFRTASDAMVVACPITNEVGHTVDGWVLMMNDRAREWLHFTGDLGNLRLNDLPQFRDVTVWGRRHAPKGATATMPLTTAQFDLELMRFPRAFGVRLRPKPDFAADAGPLAPAPGANAATPDPAVPDPP